MHTRTQAALAAVAVTTTVGGGVAASGAELTGPSPVAPVDGKAQDRGVPFTFKVKAPAGASVFLRVGKSRTLRADGTLRSELYFRSMVRRGAYFTKKTEVYPALDTYFLNRRGTYYWQAYRIECSTGSSDCNVEGPVRRFTIR